MNWLVEHPPLSSVAGDRFDYQRARGPLHDGVFGTLLVLLVGLLGRRVGRAVPRVNADAVGLVAAGIAAISPNIWVNDGLVMSETLTGVAVVGACLLAFALVGPAEPLARGRARRRSAASSRWARAELVLLRPAARRGGRAHDAPVMGATAPRSRSSS